MSFELEPERTPVTVSNFFQYVDDRFYENTLFHRVIDNFLIQGGGYESGLIQKTTRIPIKNESENGLKNERGALAMARLADDPNSATAQFFINTRNNDLLDYNEANPISTGYCAFGRILEGIEIIERIEGVATTSIENLQDVPMTEIFIERIELLTRR